MDDVVVRAEDLGKRYRIGAQPLRRLTLRQGLAALPRRAWRGVRRSGPPPETELWAVRALSFEVAKGEVLGLIGSNGSGKSTVLKLASGITEPTEGWIATRGRVTTLLEVGAGFHAELTGRENVFLSGIILGMRAAWVRQRFDEIVEFAGVARFIDTPVKYYSSGMYTRLAFSVAAHLEPEILVVDEVLAVGDLAFQARCLGKMGQVRREGRTVLFVTHSMASLRSLCTHALLLDAGRCLAYGSVDEVARRYEAASAGPPAIPRPLVDLPAGAPEAAGRVCLRLLRADGVPGHRFAPGEPWTAQLDFHLDRAAPRIVATLLVTLGDGSSLVALSSDPRHLDAGHYRAAFTIDLPLAPAELSLGVELVSDGEPLYRAAGVGVVQIRDAPAAVPPGPRRGLLFSTRRVEIVPLAPASTRAAGAVPPASR